MFSPRSLWLSSVLCLRLSGGAAMLSPDVPVSQPAHGATGGEQVIPNVAASSSMFLLVWVDQPDRYTSPHRLLGLRADMNGFPIDGEPFVISENPTQQEGLAVASDGTNFLVAWADTAGGAYRRLFATLVRADGMVSVTNGVRLDATAISPAPKLVGGAEGFLLLWEDLNEPRIRAARISSAGDVLDLSGVPMDLLPSISGVLGSDGSNYIYVAQQYLPATSNYATFRWRIAQANASVSGATQIEPAHTYYYDYLSLACNGSRFLLTALNLETNTTMFLNPDGTYLGPGPVLPSRVGAATSVSANGEFLILIASDANDRLKALRFSGVGNTISSNELAIPGAGLWEAYGFAATSNAYLLFREDADVDVVASVLSTNGSLLRQFSPQGPNQQLQPAVATDGAEYLVTWNESRDGSNLVYAARVDASGAVAPPGPLVVGEGVPWNQPQAAFADSIYLIVWAKPGPSVYARRLNRAGVWLDVAPLLVATNGSNPSVAASGTNFLVVWDNFTPACLCFEVYGAIVTTNGTLGTNDPIHISQPGTAQHVSPQTTFDGSNYVVAWDNELSFTYWVRWRSISPDGALAPGSGVTPDYSSWPLLVRHGDSAWLGWNSGNIQNTSIATAIPGSDGQTPSGVPLGISADSLASYANAIWAAGTVWISGAQSGSNYVTFTALDDGLNVAVPPFRLPEESGSPVLASNGTNLLCAYVTPAWTSSGRTSRVRMRLIYPDTTLRMSSEAGLRLSGQALHSFVIERSSDLENWQSYLTNTVPGSFEFPVPSGVNEFFRMRWYSR